MSFASNKPRLGRSRASKDPRRAVLFALLIAMALAAMDTTIVATAIPQIVGDLGGFSMMGWIFSGYLVAQTVTVPIYGKLSDVYGRKLILIFGIVVFLVGSGCCAGSSSMLWLIIFRALQGLGAGSINATVNTIAGDLYDVRERGRVQGILSSVWGVSAVLGPALGGLIVTYTTWRWLFLINLPLGAVALILIIRRLNESKLEHKHKIDYLGSGLVLLLCLLLVFGLLQGGVAWPWRSAQTVIIFAGAALVGFAAIWWERRAHDPIMPPWLWRSRLIVGSFLATIFAGVLVMGFAAFLPTWMVSVLGFSPLIAGVVLAIMSIVWPFATGYSNRLYLRIGFQLTSMIGGVFTAISAFILVTAGEDASLARLLLASATMGIGLGLIASVLLVGVQSTVTWQRRGVATGAIMFSRYLGESIGTAIFGAIANSALSHYVAKSPDPDIGALASNIDAVNDKLTHPGDLAADKQDFLVTALHLSMHDVYIGMLISSAILVGCLLIMPRRVQIVDGDANASSEPGEPTEPGQAAK